MILYTAIYLIFFTGDNFAERTTGKDCASAVTFSGETATKVVELLSDNCACKKVKEDDEPQSSCTVKRPTDCGELDKSTCKSGIYKIFPDKTDWDSYKQGFGNQNEEFWLGNDHLHQLTSQGKYKLRIDLEDFENNRKYALYEKFSVGSESSGYVLDVGGYSGDAGDGMAKQNGQKFSTKDRDNDKWGGSCAVAYKGGWWYNACHYSNLNGLYLKGPHKSYADGIDWGLWKGNHYSLKETIMMIRKA
ncbi:FCN [Mytilus edulis]|uniref:FCN n=1 Tax=Mytilus edulis TaxID=6550 RepID=A0A8S3UF97_MYTED|nr:FCN [Mytilus edulis]